jgi:uncharacterized membrane protein (UPF0127 family)
VILLAGTMFSFGPLTFRAVVEAEAGSFARWGLTVGDRLEVRA